MLIGATVRLKLPHEPGEWVDLRLLSWRESAEIRQKNTGKDGEVDGIAMAGAALERSILGWSYDAPVTKENIDRLDEATATLIINRVSGGSSEADRKNDSASSPAPEMATASTRKRGS